MIKQLQEFLKSDHWLRRYCIFSGGVFYFEPPCTSHAMLHWAIVKLIVIILVVCVLIFSLQTQAAPYITWTVCYSSDRYNAPPAPCAEKRWAAIQSTLLPIQKSGLVISEADLHFTATEATMAAKSAWNLKVFCCVCILLLWVTGLICLK